MLPDATMKPPLLWGFKTPEDLLRACFGGLERQLLDAVWRRGRATVRDIHTELDGTVAYTTIMTTLDRLYRKRLLGRRKVGRSFLYLADASSAEIEQGVVSVMLKASLERGTRAPHPLLSSFVEAVSARDHVLLDELEQLVKEQRRRLTKKPR